MTQARRTLLELDPKEADVKGEPLDVSEFEGAKVLIILGDPGAGKTHLLKSLAAPGEFRRANRAVEALPPTPRVVIDALDEVAGDTGDALDKILNRLVAAGLPRTVLSCRAQDWYGSNALEELAQIYGEGNVRVGLLQPLDEAGARIVLEGVLEDPAAFLDEARRRGLQELLRNPNDLLLLAAAAGAGWPVSRADLFAKAAEVVVVEDNETHKRRSDVRAADLERPAGWTSAALLMAGADDTAADGAELADPAAAGLSREHLRLALRGRAFAATEIGRVEPAHRTIAEHLGGRWLAGAMTTARAEARIRALLLASDGAPPTSLRGLFAWTVNFMPPAYTRHWLAADPLGLLHYGDAAILLPGQRAQLLEVLVERSRSDPDLGAWGDDGEQWRVVVIPETAPRVAELLRDATTAPALKLRLLDAAKAAPPPAALVPMLLAISEDPTEADGHRARAATAYLMSAAPESPILTLFNRLNSSATEDRTFMVRAAILRNAATLTPQMVAAVHAALGRSRDRVSAGRLYLTFERLGPADLEILLDLLLAAPRTGRGSGAQHAAAEGDHVFVRVLQRLLTEAPAAFNDDRLIALHRRGILASRYTFRNEVREQLRAVGVAADEAAFKLFCSDVVPGPPEKLWDRFVETFEMDGLLFPDNGLWRQVIGLMVETKDPALASELCVCVITGAHNRPYPDDLFEQLYDLVTTRAELRQHEPALTSRTPPEWMARRRAAEAQRAAEIAAALGSWRARFRNDPAGVSNWTDIEGLYWLGLLYDGHLASEIDAAAEESRFSNLVAGLGEPLAQTVASNLRAGLAHADPKDDRLTLTMIMAMDLIHAQTPKAIEDAALIGDPLACALFLGWLEWGLEAQDPYTGAALGDGAWHRRLVQARPLVAEQALVGHAVSMLRRNPTRHVSGLYPLTHDAVFAHVRPDWALKILEQVPEVTGDNANELFAAALDVPDHARLAKTIKAVLGRARLRAEARLRWTAAAWLLEPAVHEGALQGLLASARPGRIWPAIHVISGDERRGRWDSLSEAQLAFLVQAIGSKCPRTSMPLRGAWRGSENAWEASRLVEGLIETLGARGTPFARTRLYAMADDPTLSGYADALRRAAIAAAAGARDGGFAQRDLLAVSGALLDGPPATLGDAVATVAAELRDLGEFYRHGSGSNWRKFWNLADDSRTSKAVRAKGENECRNYLVPDLTGRLARFSLRAEELTANEDRIDIAVYSEAEMIPVEIKLDDNAELWDAASGQLSARYINDYRAAGLGIYLVLWTDGGRGKPGPLPPEGGARPTSAAELQVMLETRLAGDDRERVTVVVLDFSRPA